VMWCWKTGPGRFADCVSCAVCAGLQSRAAMALSRPPLVDAKEMTVRKLVLLLLTAIPLCAAAAPQDYKIGKVVALGAPDRWDYVVLDPRGARAYVAHGDRVTAVDTASGTVAGTIMVGGATHGALVLPGETKGYVDDGKAGTVLAFDPSTFKILRTIKAAPDADGITFDHKSGHVLVMTGDSGKVVVIDPRTDAVLAEIDGGGPLEFGVSDEKGSFFVDGEDKNEIVRMDLAANAVTAHWPLKGCQTPHGLAIDREHRRLFASCGNAVMDVVNVDTGAVVASLPIGQGSDFAAFDTARQVAFSSNRDGTLSRIAERTPDKFEILAPVMTKIGARTMALDPKTGRIYVVASDVAENQAVPQDARGHYKTVPGSAQLLFIDPVKP
jgi:YVTN family beta-propeller protein